MSLLHEKLLSLLEPAIEALGYELVLLEFVPQPGSALLRLYIDSPGGVNLDDCTRVSREVAGVLDVEDPISSAYNLEVSSPGLDRPLVKPAHYERFLQHVAKATLIAPRNGRRRFSGRIAAVNAQGVTLETAEGPVELKYSEIEKARLVPDYEQELH
ncbi:MAG TPA: ribosome maturation factor RimP [Nevskiaceae bacterium]|nr:ribosome maturation factor RimP [Nevskiaceae bacterium]